VQVATRAVPAKTQTPLFRFLVKLLYNKLYSRWTTNRNIVAWVFELSIIWPLRQWQCLCTACQGMGRRLETWTSGKNHFFLRRSCTCQVSCLPKFEDVGIMHLCLRLFYFWKIRAYFNLGLFYFGGFLLPVCSMQIRTKLRPSIKLWATQWPWVFSAAK